MFLFDGILSKSVIDALLFFLGFFGKGSTKNLCIIRTKYQGNLNIKKELQIEKDYISKILKEHKIIVNHSQIIIINNDENSKKNKIISRKKIEANVFNDKQKYKELFFPTTWNHFLQIRTKNLGPTAFKTILPRVKNKKLKKEKNPSKPEKDLKEKEKIQNIVEENPINQKFSSLSIEPFHTHVYIFRSELFPGQSFTFINSLHRGIIFSRKKYAFFDLCNYSEDEKILILDSIHRNLSLKNPPLLLLSSLDGKVLHLQPKKSKKKTISIINSEKIISKFETCSKDKRRIHSIFYVGEILQQYSKVIQKMQKISDNENQKGWPYHLHDNNCQDYVNYIIRKLNDCNVTYSKISELPPQKFSTYSKLKELRKLGKLKLYNPLLWSLLNPGLNFITVPSFLIKLFTKKYSKQYLKETNKVIEENNF